MVPTNKRRPWLAAGALSACVLAVGGCSGDELHYPSPDGQHDAVIEVANASIDTVWTVSVREKALFGDRRTIGCFTDDDPASETPTDVSWTEADEIAISTTGDAPVRVKLNPDGSAGQITQAADDFLVPCPYS